MISGSTIAFIFAQIAAGLPARAFCASSSNMCSRSDFSVAGENDSFSSRSGGA